MGSSRRGKGRRKVGRKKRRMRSKIRHRKLNVGATILLRMHEKSNIPIRELKELTSASVH